MDVNKRDEIKETVPFICDFVRLAQNMLSEKKYTQTQILSSFIKEGMR